MPTERTIAAYSNYRIIERNYKSYERVEWYITRGFFQKREIISKVPKRVLEQLILCKERYERRPVMDKNEFENNVRRLIGGINNARLYAERMKANGFPEMDRIVIAMLIARADAWYLIRKVRREKLWQ